ncbi:MAG: DUF1634 domain-containing protein [Deltaproteobacteria bacterium]|nr:DUF1634 domain-containing protein [Deltaproteobacteria bacterium]
MEEKSAASLEASPEQELYADILQKGMLVGLVALFITFAIYTFGIMKPYIPLDKISGFWNMNVHDYLQHAKIEAGWAWLSMLEYSDFLNFIGIALLAGVSIVCYAAIIPTLFRNDDKVFGIIAILEVIVLSFAASGILAVGH